MSGPYFFFPKKDTKRIGFLGSIESQFLKGGVFEWSRAPSYSDKRPTNCPFHSCRLDFSGLRMLWFGDEMFALLPACVLNISPQVVALLWEVPFTLGDVPQLEKVGRLG